MKKLLFVSLISISCFASQLPLLKELATDSYVRGFTIEDIIRVGRSYPQLQRLLVERYLLWQGYHKEISIVDPKTSLHIGDGLQEDETTFFGEGEEEGHYRPTRCPKNPFLLDEVGKFACSYQEQRTYQEKLRNHATDTEHRASFASHGEILLVGPTKQNYYAYIGADPEVIVCAISQFSGKLFNKQGYFHSYKAGEGAVSGNMMYSWYDKRSWKDYEDDQPTALTMDEETGYFYGGTQSGKLHCYSWFVNVGNEGKMEWRGATFPVSLDKKIDDIELSLDGSFLWVLSDNIVYMYQLLGNQLNMRIVVPFIPLDDLVDEASENMSLLRLTPNEQYILLGGTKGTVLIADVQTGHCFMLTKFEESESVADMWWQEDTVVLLNRAGKLRKGKVRLADAGTFFEVEE